MRNKRSSNFSDDKLVRLTVNIFPALPNKRPDYELPAGAPRTLWTNAESLGKEVDCDFQKSSRPKSFFRGVVAEIDTDLICNFLRKSTRIQKSHRLDQPRCEQ